MSRCDIFIFDNMDSLGAPGGVARYFKHIRDGLVNHFGAKASVFSSQKRNYGLAKYLHAIPEGFKGSGWLHVKQANALLASRLTRKYRPSVFYSAYYGSVQTTGMQVFTVYDMIHELYFSEENYAKFLIEEKKQCFDRASLLIAISNNTAHDIVSLYPFVDSMKIITIHLGVDDIFFMPLKKEPHTHKPFFLYIGTRGSYKNFRRAVEAFGMTGLSNDFDLRVISPDRSSKFTEKERELLKQYDLEQSVELRLAVSEIELRKSYAESIALIYPSEYEGFGLPVLEAMASGTLVAASNAASIPEAGGNVAFYFDPKSIDSIADTLLKIAGLSNDARLIKVDQGILRAREFSWQRCQQKTIEAISQLVS